MGAREDFMAVRRAAHYLDTIGVGDVTDPVTCHARLMHRASDRERDFMQLSRTPVFAEVIDLAYAILAEDREGGSAVAERDAFDRGAAADPVEQKGVGQ